MDGEDVVMTLARDLLAHGARFWQSVLKYFAPPTHKMCSGGFVIVRHVNQAGWRGGKELLGESYGEEGLSAFFVVYRTPLLCVCSRGRMLLPANIISLPPPP